MGFKVQLHKVKYMSIGVITLIFLSLVIGYWEWVNYLIHHVQNHITNVQNSYPIHKAFSKEMKLSKEIRRKLKLIESVKTYGRKIYHLQNVEVYESFVKVDRKVLGKNLIIAEPLKLELKKFSFPFLGEFSYLGFFDFSLLEQFKQRYTNQGLDVYTSNIAAFTYLTYFKDPIFSTYLHFSDYQITALVLHEMAHIKLYFKDDTNFSESIASFIENYAAQSYMKNILNKEMVKTNARQLKKEYTEFNHLITITKKKLNLIFNSKLTIKAKKSQKLAIYKRFRLQLKKMSSQNIYLKHAWLLKLKEINNAVLLQIARYNPPRETGLNVLFRKTCQNSFHCWFEQLKKLKKCNTKERKLIISEKISIEKVLKKCNYQRKN